MEGLGVGGHGFGGWSRISPFQTRLFVTFYGDKSKTVDPITVFS